MVSLLRFVEMINYSRVPLKVFAKISLKLYMKTSLKYHYYLF